MSSTVKLKRESNIELLRIISMLLIVGYHFVCFQYKSFGSLVIFSLNNFILSFFWSGGKYGVVLFGLITGYFMIYSHVSLKKIIKLELQVLFYTISIMFLFVIFLGEIIELWELKLFLFPTYMKTYWFFSSYFLLYLFIPVLNFIFLKIKKEHFLLILGILFVLLIFVPSVLVHVNIFKETVYLFFYYMVGAYIRLYMNDMKEKKIFLIVSIVFYLLIIGSTFYIQYLSNFNKILLGSMYAFTKISSVLIFVSAVCLFMFFKNLRLKNSSLINRLGNVSFGVYLFHEHTYMRKFLWF